MQGTPAPPEKTTRVSSNVWTRRAAVVTWLGRGLRGCCRWLRSRELGRGLGLPDEGNSGLMARLLGRFRVSVDKFVCRRLCLDLCLLRELLEVDAAPATHTYTHRQTDAHTREGDHHIRQIIVDGSQLTNA